MMKCCSKEQIDRSSTTKSPKTIDFSHVCPSKLSKRELEELYFALLQNNMEMKKNFNKQNEQLKVLSTKLQRMMSTQRAYMANESKDCCSATKAVVQDQKKTISEMKKANDNLKNEVKNLNMKLCSTRQFLKRSSMGPYQMQNKATSRPTSSIIGRSDSTRNSSTSALNTKKPEAVDNMQMKSVSCQCLDKLGLPEGNLEKLCDENKCRTQMDELKQKIVNLQEELNKTHEEYASRISKLEHEVTDLQDENARVRTERTARDLSLDRRNSQVKEIKKKLRETRCECEVLNTELIIEKGKVAELEAAARAAGAGAPLLQALGRRLRVASADANHKADSKKVKGCCAHSDFNEPSSSKVQGTQDESTSPTVENSEKRVLDFIPELTEQQQTEVTPARAEPKKGKGCCAPSEFNEPSSSKRTQDESTSPPAAKPNGVPTALDFKMEVPEQQQIGVSPTPGDDLTPKSKEGTPKVYNRDSEMPLGIPIHNHSNSKNKEDPSETKDKQNGDSQLKEKGSRHESCALCEGENKKNKLKESDVAAETLNAFGTPLYWLSSNDKMPEDMRMSTEMPPNKKSDDSGYVEANRSGVSHDDEKTSLQKLNDELMDKIADLQKQLNDLKARTLSNSDTYTIDSEEPSDIKSTGEPRRNHKSKRAKKEKDSDELKDVNQRWHNYDESLNANPTCDTTCRQENLDCTDECTYKLNDSKECTMCDNEPINTEKENRHKDNDIKYQIPGPVPVTSTPRGDKQAHAMKTKRDEGSASHLSVLSELKDSIVISREYLMKNRKIASEPQPLQFRPRSQSAHKTLLKSSLVKSQEEQKTNFCTDSECKKHQPAAIPENGAQTVKISPSDVSGQQTIEAPTTLTGPNVGENQPSSQKTDLANHKTPQHEPTKPQEASTIPLAKRPSHIQEIIQNLYARFAKETPKSPQAQTEGPNLNGQNIEELPTTSKDLMGVSSPPKASTEIGLHKCTCNQIASDSNAQNTTPKQVDCSCVKYCENPTTPGVASNDVTKNPVPLSDTPVIGGKKNSPDNFVKFSKEPRSVDAYLNNQNSNIDDYENYKDSRDGSQDQGNQSIGKSSVGTEVPVLGKTIDNEVRSKDVPPQPAAEQEDPIMYLPPTRPATGSVPSVFTNDPKKPKDDYTQLSNVDKAIDSQLDICEHLTHVCTCPHESPAPANNAHRDVSVFRSCSGTLRFRTTNAPASRIRRCGCSHGKTAGCGTTLSQIKYVNNETQSRKVRNDEGVQANDRRNVETSVPKTYTIHASAELVKCSRATSPENTDQEISSMTDLPSEKDTYSSPRCKKCGQTSSWTSPGEDKATTTSRTTATPTAYSLSEGEMPQMVNSPEEDLPERLPIKSPAKRNLMENSSSAQMEAALQAISHELERCRLLLLQTRTPEVV
ncbi:uncharacterized protein LOC126375246 [Pectinophora gossypiella]|uniref:uncharacterized protein LOC126375246 n=1 Tax=Pectinophora gossypiella TaxID=13191 RepID=UPI00214E6106|nr:uncharacterized protein LOC126375246 [Pectinophora gossypiella]